MSITRTINFTHSLSSEVQFLAIAAAKVEEVKHTGQMHIQCCDEEGPQ